jgi:hypothetical protein
MKPHRLGRFRTRFLRHINIHGVLPSPKRSVRHSCDGLGEGGGEEQSLARALRRQEREDLFDGRPETRVQKAIGLVKHQDLKE